MLSRSKMIEICRQNNASYDGVFFLAVKSTQIYCLPSCTARFPKEINMEFYESREKAENAGFRGCKRCYSAGYQFQPKWMTKLVEFLNNNIEIKITMSDLETLTGKHRSTIALRFEDYYNQTPIQYQRQLKLQAARNRILQGEDYRDVAFSLGYDSISGFRSAFKDHFQTTPGSISQEVN